MDNKIQSLRAREVQATIDDLNQYLEGNVTAEGLVDTLQDMIKFLNQFIFENKTDNFDLRKYLAEGRLLKEEKGINYLKDAFETYLAGGDTFTNKPGKTETVKFKNDGSLIPKNKFEVALQSLPTTVKVDVYNVNFKKVGDNIVGTFKIK
tara:strand:+ start:37 stop:486 length:450 start_codon:yes stop_codon:yes gene_type:complete